MTNTTKTLMLSTVFAAVTTLASMSDAHAQEADVPAAAAPAPAAPPPAVPAPAAPAAVAQPAPEGTVTGTPATPAAAATATDPNIDRGFLLPTAMTQPAGSEIGRAHV